MNIDIIAGTRPNFVKVAALIHAIRELRGKMEFRLIHTGQHYDENLSGSFFSQLKLPKSDFNLNVGSGSQAEQTARIMTGYENILHLKKPDMCVVVGDVTSSMACAITAKKMRVKVAHIEAGLRSKDTSMPEEINRLLIDSISDYFFTTSQNASENLLNNGINRNRVFFVGNVMIDTLLQFKSQFREPGLWKGLGLKEKSYFVITLHRPSNVDSIKELVEILKAIVKNARGLPVIFPIHPRTAKILKNLNINANNLFLVDPLSYLEFNFLIQKSKAVLTDSGGITEETTVLGIPCMTLRNNTERPETISTGTNELIGTSQKAITLSMKRLFQGKWKKGSIPELWDGKSGLRIIEKLLTLS